MNKSEFYAALCEGLGIEFGSDYDEIIEAFDEMPTATSDAALVKKWRTFWGDMFEALNGRRVGCIPDAIKRVKELRTREAELLNELDEMNFRYETALSMVTTEKVLEIEKVIYG